MKYLTRYQEHMDHGPAYKVVGEHNAGYVIKVDGKKQVIDLTAQGNSSSGWSAWAYNPFPGQPLGS